MKGTVKQPFPFAFDGANFLHLKAGDDFPPAGYTVQDKTFEGLKNSGFIEAATSRQATPEDEELNRRIIDALDKRLSAMSDEELKSVIVRRGTPFSGNMVHAQLVGEAKMQMLAEMEGKEPVVGINPNAGVTEQPLSAPGAPTPPSAAAAVEQQKVEQKAAEDATDQGNQENSNEKKEDGVQNGGENKMINQFGEPAPAAEKKLTREELAKMNKSDLEAYAAEKKVDLTGLKTKDDYLDAITGAK